jgi:hypothetical protein
MHTHTHTHPYINKVDSCACRHKCRQQLVSSSTPPALTLTVLAPAAPYLSALALTTACSQPLTYIRAASGAAATTALSASHSQLRTGSRPSLLSLTQLAGIFRQPQQPASQSPHAHSSISTARLSFPPQFVATAAAAADAVGPRLPRKLNHLPAFTHTLTLHTSHHTWYHINMHRNKDIHNRH